jgi:hypothetical protein
MNVMIKTKVTITGTNEMSKTNITSCPRKVGGLAQGVYVGGTRGIL